jgi:hypothetical protein
VRGFFESVAARTRGEAPAVRPRLPSRFEKAGPEPQEFNLETIAESPAPREPVAPRGAEPSHPPRPTIARGDSSPPPAAISPQAPRLDAPAPPSSMAVSQAEPARAEARPQAPAVPQAERLAARPLEATAVPQAERLAARPLEATGVAPPAPPLRIDAPSSVVDPIAGSDAPKPEARPTTTAKLFTPAPTEAPLALATARPAPDKPAQPAPRTGAERRAATLLPEETTVHVSIGRIEVRAAQPSPESKRREPPRSPVMSLEDYLQSRRGRR